MNFFRETMVVYRRQIRLNLRNPVWVMIGVFQPVLYLALFGPLLEPLKDIIQTDNIWVFFVPGMLVQLGVFGAMFAGFSLIGEWRDGVVEAERVTPASRTALLMGRVLRDVTQLTVQALILVALGFAFGMRGSWFGIFLGIVLTIVLGSACAAGSNALALTTKSEDIMAPIINMVMMPIILLSGILLPMNLGPAWLRWAGNLMPIKHVVSAVRDLFAGNLTAASVGWGTGWVLVLFALGLWWGTSTFRKENS